MSFKSIFQDCRDAVDWVHYKVGSCKKHYSLKCAIVVLDMGNGSDSVISYLGLSIAPYGCL